MRADCRLSPRSFNRRAPPFICHNLTHQSIEQGEGNGDDGLFAYDDFADLDDRILVGIVRDVRQDLLRVRSKATLKCLD
jgi:hypothetical protein